MTPKQIEKFEKAKVDVVKMSNAELLSRYMSESACNGSDFYYDTNFYLLYAAQNELRKRFIACGFFDGTEKGWDQDISVEGVTLDYYDERNED